MPGYLETHGTELISLLVMGVTYARPARDCNWGYKPSYGYFLSRRSLEPRLHRGALPRATERLPGRVRWGTSAVAVAGSSNWIVRTWLYYNSRYSGADCNADLFINFPNFEQ